MQGREIDLDQLMSKHETMPAIGNVRVNARGDELGPNGQIIRTKEEILGEYYDVGTVQTEQHSVIKSKRTVFTADNKEAAPTDKENIVEKITKKESNNDSKRQNNPIT